MAVIRIRFELQRPSAGIEMSKLAELSKETRILLRMLASDLGCDTPEGTWVARDFYNQGVGFDAEYQLADVDQAQAAQYVHAVDLLATVNSASKWAVPGVRPETIVQSARVATIADDGEMVRIGLHNHGRVVAWRPLEKSRAAKIIEYYEEWVEYRGMLQGVIHTLYKEANPPSFTLRDLASTELVKCIYPPDDYERVYRSLADKQAVVLVSGWIRARRLSRKISEVRVERLEPTKPLNEAALRKLFGSAPGWTADLTSDEFIDAIRRDYDE